MGPWLCIGRFGRGNSSAACRAGVACAAVMFAAVCGSADRAEAQNLIRNDSFEYFENPFFRVWQIPTGSTPTHHQNRYIFKTPRCQDLIELDYDPLSFVLDEITQSAFQPAPDSGLYLGYADIAGDRAAAVAPWTTTLGMFVTKGISVAGYLSAPVPFIASPPGANTDVRQGPFFSRAELFPISLPQGQHFNFALQDQSNRGVLVDNVHFFPLYFGLCTNGPLGGLAGFSVEGDYWSSTTGNDPIGDLQFATPAASGCVVAPQCDYVPDTRGVWIQSNEQDCKTQMMLAAWTNVASPTTIRLAMEIEGIPGQGTPGFTVQFYDWAAQKWVGPSEWLNAGKAYPGGRVKTGAHCYEVNWSIYNGMPPLSAYTNGLIWPANNRLVLARVTFGTCGDWALNCPTTWPPAPCAGWLVKLHHAHIKVF